MNTLTRGEKLKQTMIKKHNGELNYRKHMATLGSIGGKLGTTGGFASNKVGLDGLTGRERSRIAGKIGGTNKGKKIK